MANSGTTSAVRTHEGYPSTAGVILVADDDVPVARAFRRELTRGGLTVVEVHNGEEALEAALRERFDAVLANVSMPGFSGMELLRALRSHDPELPVVLVTGSPHVDTAIEAVELGAVRYLRKPVSSDLLVSVMRTAVRLRRLADLRRRATRHVLSEEELEQLAFDFDRALRPLWMAYQPIVVGQTTMQSGSGFEKHEVYGYEALVRSSSPSLSMPEALLDAAARLGRIHELGRAVRLSVATTVSRLPSRLHVFVNLHGDDLLDEQLFDPNAPLSQVANRIVLELTERASLDPIGDIRDRVARLRDLGYRIALDDLGAGYSSMGTFAKVEPDIVKLDRSLVSHLDVHYVKQKMVESMLKLCSELDVMVIAEGVERSEERDALDELGCRYQQGFCFAPPMPPERTGHLDAAG